MRKIVLTLDEEDDRDLIDLLDSISRMFRGMYIKSALRLDLDKDKDMDIIKGLPALDSPHRRYDLVKEGLRLLIQTRAEMGQDGRKKLAESFGD